MSEPTASLRAVRAAAPPHSAATPSTALRRPHSATSVPTSAAGFYIATAVLAGMAWVKHARADPDCGRSGHAYEMDDLNQSLLASETSQ